MLRTCRCAGFRHIFPLMELPPCYRLSTPNSIDIMRRRHLIDCKSLRSFLHSFFDRFLGDLALVSQTASRCDRMKCLSNERTWPGGHATAGQEAGATFPKEHFHTAKELVAADLALNNASSPASSRTGTLSSRALSSLSGFFSSYDVVGLLADGSSGLAAGVLDSSLGLIAGERGQSAGEHKGQSRSCPLNRGSVAFFARVISTPRLQVG